jgi:hypothetical protein
MVNGAARDGDALAAELSRDLAHAVELEVLLPHPADVAPQFGVAAHPRRRRRRIGTARDMGVVRRRSDRQPDVPTAVGTSLLERRGRVDRGGQIGPTPWT